MSTNVKERLLAFINHEGVTINAFTESVGLSKAFVNNIRVSIQPKTIEKIKAVYPDLNESWLLTGRGSMLVEPEAERCSTAPVTDSDAGVPYYDIDFALGFGEFSETPERITSHFLVPGFEKATCWINAVGHSMEPEISHGDYIALRLIDNPGAYLAQGDIYAFVTSNGQRTIKRLGRSERDDSLLLLPSNTIDYKPEYIPKAVIIRVFRVMGIIKRL